MLILTTQCVLNQNCVVVPLARAGGAFKQVTDILLAGNLSVIQLPCPELLYSGLTRLPKTKEEYDTKDYRSHCRRIALEQFKIIEIYLAAGYEIKGLIGIAKSPTCDTSSKNGIFMEEFLPLFAAKNISLPVIDIPADYIEGEENVKKFLHSLRSWLTTSNLGT